jgi:transposase InsO family protein
VIVEDRGQVLALVTEAVAQGSRQHMACETVGVNARTLQRWQRPETAEDGRRGPRTAPRHTLSQRERDQMVAVAARPEFCNVSPHQIVPRLADRGEYLASESSFYRVLKAEQLLAHRGRATPAHRARPRAFEVTAPRTLFSWDITYLLSAVRGHYYYLYLFVDVFSRKAVGAEVHTEESMEHSSRLLDRVCRAEGIEKHQVSVHADNGGAMKGSTMLATMQRLGVMPSFSRPSVSNDNPFSESLFRTLKYCPLYPTRPFASLEEARAWVATFVSWYNDEHLHSGIRFTTPASRHTGTDTAILAHRARVYHAAQRTHPLRWSGATRNWTKIARVTLNGVKEGAPSVTTEPRRTASGRSRDRDREWSPQAEGQLIETGQAHLDPTPGSDGSSIVDPRATGREEMFNVRLKYSHGRTGERRDDRNWTSEQAIEPHDEGVLNEATWSVSRANRRLMS